MPAAPGRVAVFVCAAPAAPLTWGEMLESRTVRDMIAPQFRATKGLTWVVAS